MLPLYMQRCGSGFYAAAIHAALRIWILCCRHTCSLADLDFMLLQYMQRCGSGFYAAAIHAALRIRTLCCTTSAADLDFTLLPSADLFFFLP
jgi:hypothetical protein